MDVTRLIFKICYISPLENNAISRLSKTILSLSKILIAFPLYITMTVLTMVYGAVAIASDCANLKKIYFRRASLFLTVTLTLLLFRCSIHGARRAIEELQSATNFDAFIFQEFAHLLEPGA